MHKFTLPDFIQNKKLDSSDFKGTFSSLFNFIQTIIASFLIHKGTLRAAALTYTTVLSLVPFLAIAFSVLKGLGAQNVLEPMLKQVAGDSGDTVSRIIAYVNNTNMKSMGAIGLVMLIVTVISLMGSIEEAFNTVWGVSETRSLHRRFSDYLSVVIVGPILLLAATSMTSSLQSQWLLQWLIHNTYLGDAILLLFRLLPYLSVWVAMVFLYIFIPNTKIRFYSALVGGVIAGTAWELAQWGYFHFQVGVANYNAIYGTLAAVPVFLVWIYTSWLIVLFGLEIVYAHQHSGHLLAGNGNYDLSTALRDQLAIALLLQITLHFQKIGTPPTAQKLADELNIQLVVLEPIFNRLKQLNYLIETSENDSGWLPAREPSKIEIAKVLASLHGDYSLKDVTNALQVAEKIIQKGWKGSEVSLNGITLQDMLEKL